MKRRQKKTRKQDEKNKEKKASKKQSCNLYIMETEKKRKQT